MASYPLGGRTSHEEDEGPADPAVSITSFFTFLVFLLFTFISFFGECMFLLGGKGSL